MSAIEPSLITDPSLFWWVGGSVLLYVVTANLLWWIRSTALLRSLYGRALFQLGRFLYYVVVPYLALGGWRPRLPGWQSQQGLLALEDLGVVGPGLQWPVTRWLEAAGTGLGLGLLVLLILWLAWTRAARLFGTEHAAEGLSLGSHPVWTVLVSAFYLEIHWAFYRGSLAVVLEDVYAGVFLGLAIACLEWFLDPFWRSDWQTASRAGWPWLNSGLALTSALLFLLTRNLWVCLTVHWLLALVFWALGRHREGVAAGHSPMPGLVSAELSGLEDERGVLDHSPGP